MRRKYISAKLLVAKGYNIAKACEKTGISEEEYKVMSQLDKETAFKAENTVATKIFIFSAMLISLSVLLAMWITFL